MITSSNKLRYMVALTALSVSLVGCGGDDEGGTGGTGGSGSIVTPGETSGVSQLLIVEQPNSALPNSSLNEIVLRALDENGTPVADYLGPLNVTLKNASGATLSGVTPAVRSEETKLFSFSGLNLDQAGNGYTLEFTTEDGITVESRPFNVVTAPTSMVILRQPSPVIGGALADSADPASAVSATTGAAIAFVDASGLPVSGYADNVTASYVSQATGATAALGGTVTQAADANGIAVFNDLSVGDKFGPGYKLSFANTNLGGAPVESNTFEIVQSGITQMSTPFAESYQSIATDENKMMIRQPSGHYFRFAENNAVATLISDDFTKPFAFNFGGKTYSHVGVSSNGIVTFSADLKGDQNFVAADFGVAPVTPNPVADPPVVAQTIDNVPGTPTFAPFWTDLLIGQHSMFYKVTGEPGSRILTVQFDRAAIVENLGPSSEPLTFQIQIHEDGSQVLYHYENLYVNDPARDRGRGNVIMGSKTSNGTNTIEAPVLDGTSYRIVP